MLGNDYFGLIIVSWDAQHGRIQAHKHIRIKFTIDVEKNHAKAQ